MRSGGFLTPAGSCNDVLGRREVLERAPEGIHAGAGNGAQANSVDTTTLVALFPRRDAA